MLAARERKDHKNVRTEPECKRAVRLFHPMGTATNHTKKDVEQEAKGITEIRKAKSLCPISVEICRSFIGVMFSFESALGYLFCRLFKPIWLRSSLCALCVLLWQRTDRHREGV